MKLARSRVQEIMKLLLDNDWTTVWDGSSMRYKKTIGKERMLKLEDWVGNELGKINNYKQTYFYCGSCEGLINGFYIKSNYEVAFEKGVGEVEITLVKEKDDFKLTKLNFVKKPLY
jgi:hypothetical protein